MLGVLMRLMETNHHSCKRIVRNNVDILCDFSCGFSFHVISFVVIDSAIDSSEYFVCLSVFFDIFYNQKPRQER